MQAAATIQDTARQAAPRGAAAATAAATPRPAVAMAPAAATTGVQVAAAAALLSGTARTDYIAGPLTAFHRVQGAALTILAPRLPPMFTPLPKHTITGLAGSSHLDQKAGFQVGRQVGRHECRQTVWGALGAGRVYAS